MESTKKIRLLEEMMELEKGALSSERELEEIDE